MLARILLLDDNVADLTRMARLLQAAGYTSLVVGTGGDALVAIRREMPDLVICDPDMQSANGFALAARVRTNAELCDIRLLAATTYGNVRDRERLLAAGYDGYITKPINPETFIGHVEIYLPSEQRASLEPCLPRSPLE